MPVPVPPKNHRTRGRSETRSSPLLGNDALMAADKTLTRKGNNTSQTAGHAETDAAGGEPPALTGTPLEQQAAASPVVAQQDGVSSSSSGIGSPARLLSRSMDEVSTLQLGSAQPSPAQGYRGLAATSPRNDDEAQVGLGDAVAPMALSSADGNSPRSSGRGGEGEQGEQQLEEEQQLVLSKHIWRSMQDDTTPLRQTVRRALHQTALLAEVIESKVTDQAVTLGHLQDDASVAAAHRAAVEEELAILTGAVTADLHGLQTRVEKVEDFTHACVAAADVRADALGERVATLEAQRATDAASITAMARTISLLTDRIARLECDANDPPPPALHQRPYTPGTAYHSAQREAPTTTPAQAATLSALNLRALGGTLRRRDDDERSRYSVQSTHSLLRKTPAPTLPPRPSSVLDAPRSSITATVRETPAAEAARRFPWSLADPMDDEDPPFFTLADPAQARAAKGGSMKGDARAQLDGAVREARDQQLRMVTLTVPARTDLAQQLDSEAERNLKATAEKEALAREREQLSKERAEVERAAREHAMRVQKADLDAQERSLAAQRARMDADMREVDTARSMLAHSLASRHDGDDSESERSWKSRRIAGNGAGGGAGGGGGGSGSGSGSTVEGASSGGNDAARAAASAAALAADEWPGRPQDLPRAGWFDSRGYAITKVAVQIREADLPKTTLAGQSMAPLVILQRMLPSLIREGAAAGRQKQRPLWPALITADDYGCDWFSSTIRSVLNCVVSGGGDNYRVGTLLQEMQEWQRQGEALTVSDPELLDWLFSRIAKHLELRRPSELAADLVRWVVKPGLPLRDFVYEFSAAASAVLSGERQHDNFVLMALLGIVRHQYAATAIRWSHIHEDPHLYKAHQLLDILRSQSELAAYYAVERPDNQTVYPTDLRSYAKATFGGSGLGAGGAATPKTPAAKKPDPLTKQETRILYMIHAIQIFSNVNSSAAARTCFNCGSDQHSFARCGQPYSSASWDAAVQKLPWVAKFRPTGAEDYARLCAKALERAANGESGRSARKAWESQRDSGAGRGDGRRSGRGGRGGDN